MPTLDRDGVAIHYEDHGPKDADTLPVLLTHGYAATCLMWRPQVAAFADRYRLISWDMRGHGQSDSPPDDARYSRELTVEDMRAILDELGIEQAVIAGHSLGGYMSLAFRATHPERMAALILQGTGPGYRNPVAREAWNEDRLERARRLETIGMSTHDGGSEVDMSEHSSAEGLARSARGMLTQHDSLVIDGIASITLPTLLLVGENDTPFRNSMSYMENRIEGSELHVFDGAGHGVNIEAPEGVNAAIEGFLARLAGGAS
ncbi:MAG: alpha/beta fold hydrolase [Chloroflexi bacterium]|nr:alpha/beta fold hydrolase [Chloroflexota bacterium]